MTVEPSATPGPHVVLHAERLTVGTEQDVVRAVVRRRIVTETRQVEVVVRREVVEVEYLPVDGDAGPVPPAPTAPIEMVLSEEVPVVTTALRPYERVVVDVAVLEQQQDVVATVSQERAEVSTT